MRTGRHRSEKATHTQAAEIEPSKISPQSLHDQGAASVQRVLEDSSATTSRGLIEEIQALASALPSTSTDQPGDLGATDAGRLHELCLQIDSHDEDTQVIATQLTHIRQVALRLANDAAFSALASAIAQRAAHALSLS